jgi:hypothetical protein
MSKGLYSHIYTHTQKTKQLVQEEMFPATKVINYIKQFTILATET